MTNLRRYLKARTTLIASHRLEAMRAADVIFVLEGGRLQEQGSHDQLLAQKGIYAALYRRQKLEAELYEEAVSGQRTAE